MANRTAFIAGLAKFPLALVLGIGHIADGRLAGAATLTVQELTLVAGESRTLVVEGHVQMESTFGVTVLVELIPCAETRGTLTFTPAPPTDIAAIGDPWPGAGTFTAFDTNSSGGLLLNGAVSDNGTFVPSPTTFQGPLFGFPVVAGFGACGVWDVVLSTSAGESSWEGLVTTRVPATITVTTACDVPAASGGSLFVITLLILLLGVGLPWKRSKRTASI